MFDIKRYGVFWESEGNGGGGNPPTSDKIIERYKSDPTAIAMKLAEVMKDNYDYRQTIATLKTDLATLGDEKTALEQSIAAYQELGEPDKVKEQLATAQTSADELAALKREKVLSDVATKNNLKPSLLKLLATNVDFKIETVEADGESVAVTKVLLPDGEKTIKDYFTSQGDGVWESLQVAPITPSPDSVRYPSQPAPTTPPNHDPIADRLKQMNAAATKPNALTPAASGA